MPKMVCFCLSGDPGVVSENAVCGGGLADPPGMHPIPILTAIRLLLFAADEFGFQSFVVARSEEDQKVVVSP